MFFHKQAGMKIAGSDQHVIKDRTTDEPRYNAVQKTAGDHVILARRRQMRATRRICNDREKGRHTQITLRQCLYEFAGDSALPRPPVNKDDLPGIVAIKKETHRVHVDPASANDADRIVMGLDADPSQLAGQKHANRRAGPCQRDQHALRGGLAAQTDLPGKPVDIRTKATKVSRHGIVKQCHITRIGDAFGRQHFRIMPLTRLD